MLTALVTGSKKTGKLSYLQIAQISDILIALRPYVPREFARKPKSLDELCRWKAIEFRTFLYYLGPLIFNTVLSTEYATHFNALHASVFILSHPVNYRKNDHCADELLTWFIETYKKLYREDRVIFTVHCMKHLPKQTLTTGPLDLHTSYPFENYLQTLKKNDS